MIIDSHCHLDYEPMKSSLDEVLGRAASEGIDFRPRLFKAIFALLCFQSSRSYWDLSLDCNSL